MKNHLFRTCSLILALLAAAPLAVGCGDNAGDTKTTDPVDTSAVTETETIDENDRKYTKDTLPDGLDFDKRKIKIYYAGKDEENLTYYEGDKEQAGDVVVDAVLARNLSVEERLNVDVESVAFPESTYATVAANVQKLILAGDNTYDFYIGQQCGLCTIISEGGFINAYDIDYLDFTMPWWNNAYMDEIAIGNQKRFFLAGDYQIGFLRQTRAVYYNKQLYQQYYDDANGLYQDVLDGTWTLDKLISLAKSVYIDLNNDGVTDLDDQLGYVTHQSASSVDAFVYSSDITLCRRGDDGIPYLTLMSDDAVKLNEKLVELFYQEGSYFNVNDGKIPYNVFSEDRALFLGNAYFSSVDELRDMKSDYGIIPNPKFDEEQEGYHSLVHDCAPVGLIPETSENTDIIGAVLEALCAETYRTVIPAYYETALKVKYSRDDLSSQMIDLIHDSMTTNFVFAYNYALSNAGLMYRNLVSAKSTTYASSAEKIGASAEKKLAALIDTYMENN